MKPSLLFVSPRFLFPADEGGKIRTSNILRRLKGGAFEIVLASPAPADTAPFAAHIDSVCDRFIGWKQSAPSRMRRLAALADARPVSVATDDTPAGRDAVSGALLLVKPDVVVFDFPHAAVLAPAWFSMPSVLFTHNIEAEIYERHARLATGLWRLVWPVQAQKMKRFEAAVIARFDRVIAVSARDANALAKRYAPRRVDAIDTGVDLDFFEVLPAAPPPAPDGGCVVFTGVMDSPANSDGVRYLAEQVWPVVLAARPAARALIIGRNPSPALRAACPASFTFTGTVDDIRPHVARGHVAVIPLNVGSGTRIKAYEAMAMGRCVVSTSIGVEGLAVEDGEHLLIADDAKAFAAAILQVLGDATLRERLAANARHLVATRFSWAEVAKQFEKICQFA